MSYDSIKLMNNFINLSSDETWSCIGPHITSHLDFNKLKNSINKRLYKEIIKKFIGLSHHEYKKQRTEEVVKTMYDKKWSTRDPEHITAYEGGNVPVNWNSKKFVIDGLGLSNLQTLRIMKLIEKIKPKSVLDVGCGNGERLFQLACRYPKIKFTGLELSNEGIETAKSIQKLEQITSVLINASPQKLVDLTAHKGINFVCASAKKIPFEDNSFDLVYTSLSLEQMELIREYALKEIFRVTNQYSSFYEAFKDYNNKLPQVIYINLERYFRGSLKDLTNLGYKIVEIIDQIPQKTYMNAVFAIVKK